MTFVPVPGYGAGRLDPDGNLAAYLDRRLMLGHLWRPTWDPEGFLSTLPAIATTLIGALAGAWLRSRQAPRRKVAGLLAAGAVGLLAGRLLVTGGFAMALLAAIYWLVDIRGYRRWGAPFVVFGTNSILVFSLSTLLAKASSVFKVTRADGRLVSWHGYVYHRFFAPLASPKNASLLFALAFVLLWLGLTWVLYRRRIFVKI